MRLISSTKTPYLANYGVHHKGYGMHSLNLDGKWPKIPPLTFGSRLCLVTRPRALDMPYQCWCALVAGANLCAWSKCRALMTA
jgi:hypothetical protein